MRTNNGTPRVDIAVVNSANTSGYDSLDDIFAWAGPTQMGIPDEPMLVQSEIEFKQKFGGSIASSDFPKLCIRALRGGAKLLISRMVHRNAGVVTGDKASVGIFNAKSIGTWGNNLKVSVTAGLRPNTVVIAVSLTGITSESYTIASTPTDEDIAIANASLRYVDLKASTIGVLIPITAQTSLVGGTDTGTITANDYLGNQLDGTGIYAFDKAVGIKFLSCPDVALNQVDRAIVDYAKMRNAIALLRTPIGITGDLAVKYRNCEAPYTGTPIDSYQAFMFTGGVKVAETNGLISEICELADVAIAISKKNVDGKIWNAFAIQPFSFLQEAVGVVYNLGVPSRQTESDGVYNAGLNAVIQDETSRLMVWGDFTLQKDFSALSYTGNVELLQDVIVKLKPILKSYISKSNIPATWRLMHQKIKRILDNYKTDLAYYDYRYLGDQNVTKIEDVRINDVNDVNAGTYKLIIEIQFSPTMRYITLELQASMQGIIFTVQN